MFKRSLFGRLTPTSAQHLIFPASVNDAPSTQLLKPNPGLTLDSSFLYSSPSSFFSNLAGCSSKWCSESVLLLSHANVLWQEWVQPADGINGKKASRAGTWWGHASTVACWSLQWVTLLLPLLPFSLTAVRGIFFKKGNRPEMCFLIFANSSLNR